MKEKIYTIPVNEGFEADGECAFCEMYKKLEEDALSYTLGPSYMEQDVRDITNAKGFCREHYRTMYDAKNRLGLALMVSTHMAEIEKNMTDLLKREMQGKSRGGLFKKSEESPMEEFAKKLDTSCAVCDKIDSNMERFFDTFFYLWKKETEFRERVLSSKGFCVQHFEALVRLSAEKLGVSEREKFLEGIAKIQSENFERVKEELLWFISKFDYRFQDRPWGNSKDSLKRAILKVASYDTEKKFEKE